VKVVKVKKLGLFLGLIGLLILCVTVITRVESVAQDAASRYSPGVTPPKARVVKKADIPAALPYKGVHSKRLYTDSLFITMVTTEAGSVTGFHNHPDEQTMFIEKGKVRATVGENRYELGPGDILIIPSYVPHTVESLQASAWTEVHGPGFTKLPQ